MPADPQRTCVGCRVTAAAHTLVRIVAVDDVAVVDQLRRMPGRGVWLHPGPQCVAVALTRRALPRGLRATTLDTSKVVSHQMFT